MIEDPQTSPEPLRRISPSRVEVLNAGASRNAFSRTGASVWVAKSGPAALLLLPLMLPIFLLGGLLLVLAAGIFGRSRLRVIRWPGASR